MPSWGRQLFNSSTVQPTRVSSDGSPRYKPGGATLDLTLIPAASGSDITTPDGSIIKAGFQFLRYGQVMTRVTGGGAYPMTLNTTGVPTGGSFVLNVTTTLGTQPVTLLFNETAANTATKIAALSNVGAGNVTATGGPLTTGAVTLTFAGSLGTVGLVMGTNGLTGGTTPATTIGAGLVTPNNLGKYGPFDPTVSDGRQTLTPGSCYVLDETIVINPSGSIAPQTVDVTGGLIDGGMIFLDRVIQSGTVAHTLALGPTLAEFMAAFPNFGYVQN